MKLLRKQFASKSLARRSALPLAILVALFVAGMSFLHPAKAQSPADAAMPPATPDGRPLQVDRGAAGLWQMLLKLHTSASLMLVVAHPDDEDSGMLSLELRGQGARTN